MMFLGPDPSESDSNPKISFSYIDNGRTFVITHTFFSKNINYLTVDVDVWGLGNPGWSVLHEYECT